MVLDFLNGPVQGYTSERERKKETGKNHHPVGFEPSIFRFTAYSTALLRISILIEIFRVFLSSNANLQDDVIRNKAIPSDLPFL